MNVKQRLEVQEVGGGSSIQEASSNVSQPNVPGAGSEDGGESNNAPTTPVNAPTVEPTSEPQHLGGSQQICRRCSFAQQPNHGHHTTVLGPFNIKGLKTVKISNITGDQYQFSNEYHLNIGIDYSFDGTAFTSNYTKDKYGKGSWFWKTGHVRKRTTSIPDILVQNPGHNQIWLRMTTRSERGPVLMKATIGAMTSNAPVTSTPERLVVVALHPLAKMSNH